MWSLIPLACLVLTAINHVSSDCPKTYKKIGCFYDQLQHDTMLINGRADIKWGDFHTSTHKLACDCIAKAKPLGFEYIQIGFYGECKGGKNFAKDYPRLTPSNTCVNVKYAKCLDDSNHDCVGVQNTGYIYKLDGGRDRDAVAVDGGYSVWTAWTDCSVSCGSGEKTRERQCNNPLPANSGKNCERFGDNSETQTCKIAECPIDGGFSEWTSFGQCTKQCGGGQKTATRQCNKPPPTHGGKNCEGPLQKTESCGAKHCAVDGGFSEWTAFGKCSASCGGGYQEKTRSCTNPAPAHGGKDCVGYKRVSQDCNTNPCPVNGGFSSWSRYGDCSKSCGSGSQQRERKCDNPTPAYGGSDCSGVKVQSQTCGTNECPINGKWGQWSEYESCSLTCGGGKQYRTRKCDSPAPKHGGDGCQGDEEDVQNCNTNECPINGGVGAWSSYSKCSVSCGGGSQEKTRPCNNPKPQNGGKNCNAGDLVSTRECGTQQCPINGGWSKFSDFGKCSLSCGGGVSERSRTCNNPTPQHGGKSCAGESTESKSCNENKCPVDGGFTNWGTMSKCSKSCGTGTKSATRTCTKPKPQFGGEACEGPLTKTEQCNTNECPVDGGVSEWGAYTSCSKSCGGGEKSRSRTCTNPKPAHGGKACSEELSEEEECNSNSCPINGGFTGWSSYGKCSKNCGSGSQESTRSCTNPATQFGGEECSGPTRKTRACNTQPCPINGGFSQWSKFNQCTAKCGGGVQSRTRACNSPAPQHGGQKCQGDFEEEQDCNADPCPVNGGVSAWGDYTDCTKSCGGGEKTKTRTCTNPTPKYGGEKCSEALSRTEDCNTDACPINGAWSKWGDYGDCTTSCGGGEKTKTRSCNNPPSAHGGEDCEGASESSTACNTQACPVDGAWGDWPQYGTCSKTCGGGTQQSIRKCNKPGPAHGGDKCEGTPTRTRKCNTLNCPVDGVYSPWSKWSTCSAKCGGGKQSSTRACNNPAPQYGGKACQGGSRKEQVCNSNPCPIDGGFTDWTDFSKCSKSCGSGSQYSTRSCTNPAPKYGGQSCTGDHKKTQACNTQSCPVNGNWGNWGKFQVCSKSCSGGIQHRYRSCNNPSPAHGGKQCMGGSSKSLRACNTHHCPVDGRWTDFGRFGACSKLCGGGKQVRSRTCTNPAPKYGGKTCGGSSTHTQVCNTHNCPVNGGFGQWSSYGACSLSCGGGTKERTRECNNPTPKYGGAKCRGDHDQSVSCNTQHCPVDGGFGQWGSYSACSVSCSGGTKRRYRACNAPVAKYGGKGCTGSSTSIVACNTHRCPVNGNWGSWSAYGACSKSCGGGTQTRTHACNSPTPQHGGKNCQGVASNLRACNTKRCPINGNWGGWGNYGTCSKTCGGGIHYRYRKCNNPAPAYGGKGCTASSKHMKACNTHHCPVNGNWSGWSAYGACSKNCGGGSQSGSRRCNNPSPKYGGKSCAGSATRNKNCNTHACPVNGNWGGWGSYGACSLKCNGGIQKKYRSCNNPAPAHGGKACPGGNSFLKACNTHHCAVNGNWGGWGAFSSCSKKCGGGVIRRTRTCSSPAPAYGGKACSASGEQLKACNTHSCAIDGGWGNWGSFGICSKKCGGGIHKRYRLCNNPTPKHGGKNCIGSGFEFKGCNTFLCTVKVVNGGWSSWGRFSTCSKKCGGGIRRRMRTCTNPTPQGGGKNCAGSNAYVGACNTRRCRG